MSCSGYFALFFSFCVSLSLSCLPDYARDRVTGCRFVQFADSYTWIFQACTLFTMPIKKKPVTRAIKQATMSTIFSALASVACRIRSMQTIKFDYQRDSVSRTAFKLRNHAAAAQHPLPILIIDGEKIILLYVTFTNN